MRFEQHLAPRRANHVPLTPFHIAFALFRFAVIFVGIAHRATVGSAAAADAGEVGALAARFAHRAEEVIRDAA